MEERCASSLVFWTDGILEDAVSGGGCGIDIGGDGFVGGASAALVSWDFRDWMSWSRDVESDIEIAKEISWMRKDEYGRGLLDIAIVNVLK